MGERIGIFGGTFDPPHLGHLVTAVNVRHALDLDRVLLVVANVPWQKVGTRVVSPAADRLAMVRAAVDGVHGLEASDVELRRGGASYTADTLRELRTERPGDELFVVLGSDAAAGLASWERAEEVRAEAAVVVVERPGAVGQVPPEGWRWSRVDVPRLDVSSTDLRARAADGRPLDYLLTPAVIACVRSRGLYVDGAARRVVDTASVPVDGRRGSEGPPGEGPAELPPRRHRRRHSSRRRARRAHSAIMAVVAVAAAVAVGLAGVRGFETIYDSRAGRSVQANGASAEAVLPATPVALLAQSSASGGLAAVTLLALAPGGRGGFVILVPPGLRAEVPGLGAATLAQAWDAGGADLLADTVQALFQIKVEQTAVLDPAAWAELVAPFAPFEVDFASDVRIQTPTGLQVLVEAGGATLAADAVAGVLEARLASESELARLARHEELWSSLLAARAAAGAEPAAVPTAPSGVVPGATEPGDDLGLDEFLAGVASGEWQIRTVVTTRAGSSDGGEAYDAPVVDLRVLAAQAMPGAVSPAGEGWRVRLVNATGRPEAVLAAAAAVLGSGASLVIASDDASGAVPQTQVVYDEQAGLAAGQAMIEALGVGTPGVADERILGVDVSVTLGQDYEALVGDG